MPELYTIIAILSLILFSIGVVSGWLLSRNATEDIFTRPNLQIAVGILVTIVWAITIAAEILVPTYTVSVLIHGIMGAVVGYLFSDDGLDINIGRPRNK